MIKSKSCHWCICVKRTLTSTWLVCEQISSKERLFTANELTWFYDSLHSRSFVLTDLSLRCSRFSYQSGEEDWQPANRVLSLGHCRWILANEKLHHMIHRWTTYRTRDWTNERSERFFLPNWLMGTEHQHRAMKSMNRLVDWERRETCHSAKHFLFPVSQMWRFLTAKEKRLSSGLKKQIEVVTLVINGETNQQLQLWCYYNVVFVVYF